MAEAQQIVAVIVLGMVALVGVAVFGTLAGIAIDTGISAGEEEIEDFETDESVLLDSSVTEDPNEFELAATRESAVAFDGDGFATDNIEDLESGDWAISATAALEEGYNTQATYSLFAAENASVLVEFRDGEYRAINYVGEESATASVAADEPDSMTGIVVSWDETAEELTLYSGNQTDTAGLTSDNPERSVANGWLGTIDEVRVFNGTVDQETAEAYNDDPVQPLADQDHHARYMFNEGSGAKTAAYYSGTNATLTGATWTDGVAGPTLEEGVDYAISTNPLEVTIVSGSYLEDAPVAFVTWGSGYDSSVMSVISGMDSAMQLVPIIMLAMLAAVLIGVVGRIRQ